MLLKNHQIMSSQNFDDARAFWAEMIPGDTISLLGKKQEIDAEINGLTLGDLSLVYANFGDCDVHIQSSESESNSLYLLLPMHGTGHCKHLGQEFELSTDQGLIRDMRRPLSATELQFATLGVSIPIDKLERHYRLMVENTASQIKLDFDCRLDLGSEAGRHLRNTMTFIANSFDGVMDGSGNAKIVDQFQDFLLTNTLLSLPNFNADIDRQLAKTVAVPHYVKRARDYIQAHADQSITIETLVEHAGCSYRTLQRAFGNVYDMAPMTYLKTVRLERAHEDLMNASHGETITDIATRWGFTHLSRFAKSYVKQYGVLPSETLRHRD
ncbi:MAG: hypothetical protein CMO10_06050 [Thalassospira sp.]|nr:hypothetical protein [Thalassospira sp.]|tara:strand:- start:6685 stop:7662 length:978 start_codon:yes stop_codon:yes gene_type:complete